MYILCFSFYNLNSGYHLTSRNEARIIIGHSSSCVNKILSSRAKILQVKVSINREFTHLTKIYLYRLLVSLYVYICVQRIFVFIALEISCKTSVVYSNGRVSIVFIKYLIYRTFYFLEMYDGFFYKPIFVNNVYL